MKAYLDSQGISMKRMGCYAGLTAFAGMILGIVGDQMDWSHGVSLAVTTVICGPLSMAPLWENPLDRLYRSVWGRRTSRRPSA
jgi:sugar phosphate permease